MKTGRPKKDDKDKTHICVQTYLTEDEDKKLEILKRETGMSKSALVHDFICQGKVVEPISQELGICIRQLAGMANNLNQLAHKANAEGFKAVAETCLSLLSDIQDIISKITK